MKRRIAWRKNRKQGSNQLIAAMAVDRQSAAPLAQNTIWERIENRLEQNSRTNGSGWRFLRKFKESIKQGNLLKIASLNVANIREAGKREMTEIWMRSQGIDLLGIQETKNEHDRETRSEFTWFFSGETKNDERKQKQLLVSCRETSATCS